MKNPLSQWKKSRLGHLCRRMLGIACMAPSLLVGNNVVQAVVQADKPGHVIPKTLYGIFFEDINGGADGGIYAELLENRGFDWPEREMLGWKKEFRGGGVARLLRETEYPVHPNTANYMRIEVFDAGKGGGVGVSNDGFQGITVKEGARYELSFYARPHADYRGGLTLNLESASGETLATWQLPAEGWRNRTVPAVAQAKLLPNQKMPPVWEKYSTTLTANQSDAAAKLVVLLDAPGTVDLEFVSLFPRDTYAGRPRGMRADLVEMLKELKPGALRFPGGCIVEGVDLANMYDWKRTVGPIEGRPPNWNLWGYWQSGGLGFYEYFQLAEDIGAEPLPVLAAGMSCQFRKAEIVPLSGLQPFIQSALDLIEFANGGTDTTWGKLRAEMGHPKPFTMKFLGIGNENWGPEFIERYHVIAKAVRAKYPEIQLVSSSGAGPHGPEYDLAWKELPKGEVDLIDEHYYVSPEFLFQSNARYDTFDRKGPKVYVGEYACHMPDRHNSQFAALAEAHMMTGFERNSDVVVMTSYAPLFSKKGNTQWVPDLIWFDNKDVFATPSYYVQKLFMNHLPDRLLPSQFRVQSQSQAPAGRIGFQTWLSTAEFKNVQVTRGAETLYVFDPAKKLEGFSAAKEGTWEVVDGVLRQTNLTVKDTAICIGETSWQNYTLTLQARKTGGAEGFIIRLRDSHNSYLHVNFGGWENTQHGVEQNGPNPITQVPGVVENNKWYDVKITLDGEYVSAWLDGKMIFERVHVPAARGPTFTMVAGKDDRAGEIVLKCVNPANAPMTLDLNLAGAKVKPGTATMITLADDPSAHTQFGQATKAPVTSEIQVTGPTFPLQLQPSSMTVLRVKVQ